MGWLSNLGSQRKNHNTEIVIVPKPSYNGSASVVERLQPLEYYLYHSVSDQNPQCYTHTRMHPLTVLDEKTLSKKASLSFIPDMSKDQCLELLEYSQLVTQELNRQHNPLSEFLFENYTCSHENIALFDELEVLTLNGYTSYRKYLLQKLAYLQEQDLEFMSRLHSKLLKPVMDAFERIDNDTESLYESIPHLCIHMKKHQMLPALVFHFDKHGIKTMIYKIIDYLIITGQSLLTSEQKSKLQSYVSHKPIEAYIRIEFVDDNHLTGMIEILKQNGIYYIQHAKDNRSESVRNIIEIPLLKEITTTSNVQRDVIDYQVVSNYLKGLITTAAHTEQSQNNCSYREDVKRFYENEIFSCKTVLPKDDEELLVLAFRFGCGMHHSSVDPLMLQEVEKLFRMKLLPVAIATGTLSYGNSMPCKTSVIADNSMFMLKIYFQQLSGRAGRRGFDPKGNVVIMNMLLERVRRYLTTNLPNLNGSFGNTNTFILRLITFCMLSELRLEDSEQSEHALEDAVSALTQPLSLFTQATNVESNTQHYHYTRFAFEFLRHYGYISKNGLPIGLTGLVSKLFYSEPDNFLFVYLLRKGVFDHIVGSISEDDEEDDQIIQEKARQILEVLAYLFNRCYIRNKRVLTPFTEFQIETMDKQPLKISDLYNEFHKDTFNLYLVYLKSFSRSNKITDLILPYSGIDFSSSHGMHGHGYFELISKFKSTSSQTSFQIDCVSSFSALSGNHDDHFTNLEDIKQHIKHTITVNGTLIPIPNIVDPNSISSYILDYFDHGESSILANENGFKYKKDAEDNVANFLKVVKKILSTFNQKVDFNNPDIFVDGKIYITDNNNRYLAQVIDIKKDTYRVCMLEGPEAYRDREIQKDYCEAIPLTEAEKLVRKRNVKMQRVLEFIKKRLGKLDSEDENTQKALIWEIEEKYNKLKNQLFDLSSQDSSHDLKISLKPGKKREALDRIERTKMFIEERLDKTLSNNPECETCSIHFLEAIRLLNILHTKISRLSFDFEEDQTEQLMEAISSINLELSNTNIRLYLDLLFNNKEKCLEQIQSFKTTFMNNSDNNESQINSISHNLDKIEEIISNLPFTEHLSQYCVQENPLWSLIILTLIRKKLAEYSISSVSFTLSDLTALSDKKTEKSSVTKIIDSLDLKEHEIYLKSLHGLSQENELTLKNIEICKSLLKSYHGCLFTYNYYFIKNLAKFQRYLHQNYGLAIDNGRIDNFQDCFCDIYKIIGENYDNLSVYLNPIISSQTSPNNRRALLMQVYSEFYNTQILVKYFEKRKDDYLLVHEEELSPSKQITQHKVMIAKHVEIVHVSIPNNSDKLEQRIMEDIPNDREFGFFLKTKKDPRQLERKLNSNNIPYSKRGSKTSRRYIFTSKKVLKEVVERFSHLVYRLCYEKDHYYRLKEPVAHQI